MNYEIKNITSNNTPIYYARAASTQGNKVRIYRFAMIQECVELSHKIIKERHPVKRAVLRQQLAQFIIDHIEEFSGDRSQMINYAARCNLNALYVIEDKVLLAERMTLYTKRTIAAIEKLYKGFITPKCQSSDKQNPSYSTDSQRHLESKLPAEVKSRLDELRKKRAKYSALHRQYQQICPRHICDQVIKMADIFKNMDYPRF